MSDTPTGPIEPANTPTQLWFRDPKPQQRLRPPASADEAPTVQPNAPHMDIRHQLHLERTVRRDKDEDVMDKPESQSGGTRHLRWRRWSAGRRCHRGSLPPRARSSRSPLRSKWSGHRRLAVTCPNAKHSVLAKATSSAIVALVARKDQEPGGPESSNATSPAGTSFCPSPAFAELCQSEVRRDRPCRFS